MGKETNAVNDLSKTFVCGICWMNYTRRNREPITLRCGHTFCRRCLQILEGINGISVSCGMCRSKTFMRVSQMKKSEQFSLILDKLGLIQNDPPEEPNQENAPRGENEPAGAGNEDTPLMQEVNQIAGGIADLIQPAINQMDRLSNLVQENHGDLNSYRIITRHIARVYMPLEFHSVITETQQRYRALNPVRAINHRRVQFGGVAQRILGVQQGEIEDDEDAEDGEEGSSEQLDNDVQLEAGRGQPNNAEHQNNGGQLGPQNAPENNEEQ